MASAGVSAGGYLAGVRPSISVDDEYLRVRNLQKPNLATADDRQVRADRIAAEIAERAAGAGGRESAAAITLSASERITLSASTSRAMAWALAAIVAVTAARILVGG